MKKILLALSFLIILSMVFTMTKAGEFAVSETVHYYQGENIGDVHPFWDEESQTWYMYYLRSDGHYTSALLRSSDMLSWEQTDITSYGTGVAYSVLGVQKAKDGAFYSWYGSSSMSLSASRSEDLLHWKNPGSAYGILMDYRQFVSIRDPYVFFDEDANVWRVICTAYRSNQLQGKGLGLQCALAVSSTDTDTPDHWHSISTALIEYPNGLEGEPECPQMMKIGNRWYIFVSLARRHENHVGKLSYYIGEEDTDILEQDWNEKEEHFLTSEDLCAAQVVQGPDGIYLWGWIAKNWNGSEWGGHLSLPLQVKQNEDGTLAVNLASKISDHIRGKQLAEGTNEVFGNFDRWDADVCFRIDLGQSAIITCANGRIEVSDAQGLFSIGQDDSLTHVSYHYDLGALSGEHTMRIIAEENILEVYLDGQWALAARMQQDTACDKISILNNSEVSIKVYELK